MDPDQFLIIFAWLFILVMVLLAIVPYLRGRSDLATSWNLFLVGSANFVGASAIGAAGAHYIEYEAVDYFRFCFGAITFYATLVLVYHRLKLPRRVAGGVLLKWPPVTVPVLYLMVPITLLFVVGDAVRSANYLSVPICQIGIKAIVFTLVLAFVAWYKQRLNLVLLATWPTILLVSLILGVMAGVGRRLMVASLLAVPICLYWMRWRYRKPRRNLVAGSITLVCFIVVIGAYTQVRHRGRGEGVVRDFSYAVESLKIAWSNLLSPETERLLGQNTAECSLLAIHMYTQDMKPEPFHTLIWVLVNPIPRAIWPAKPAGLGDTLPKDARMVYGIPPTRSTWGPGIVGHAYHEGGAVMLVFYGILFGAVLRFFDELLMRQPDNPYLLGWFAAVSSHIMGWSRGDIGTFAIQIIAGFLMLLVVRWIGRLIFGTGLAYPRTSHLDVTKHGYVAQ